MKILVVDDELSCQISILDSLQALGHEAKGVATHEDAMTCLKNDTFDVILTDYRLREQCSEEFIQDCIGMVPETPVVLISGHLCKHAASRLGHCGARAFLQKPFDLITLRDCLMKLHQPMEELTSTKSPMSA